MGGGPLFPPVNHLSQPEQFPVQCVFSFVGGRSLPAVDSLGPKAGPKHAIRRNERKGSGRNGSIRSVEPHRFLEAYKTSWTTLDAGTNL